MTCADIRGLASNYMDAELPAELHDRIQRHVLKCAECALEISSLTNAVTALRSAHPVPVPSEAFIQAALTRFNEELAVSTRPALTPGQLVLGIGRE